MGSHWQSKTKRTRNDILFSEYIRRRDKRCQYRRTKNCIPYEDPDGGIGHLDCSHYVGRGNWKVRFDPENADAACRSCHDSLEREVGAKDWLEKFKQKQLGMQRWGLLQLKAFQSTAPYDEKLTRIYVKELLKSLK